MGGGVRDVRVGLGRGHCEGGIAHGDGGDGGDGSASEGLEEFRNIEGRGGGMEKVD